MNLVLRRVVATCVSFVMCFYGIVPAYAASEDEQATTEQTAEQANAEASASDSNTSGEAVATDDASSYEALTNSFRYKEGKPISGAGSTDATSEDSAAEGTSIQQGNMLTQSIEGLKTTDASWPSGAKYIGIDVSRWNGNIDWVKVKNAGVDFAIIRCGYSSQGYDETWIQNVKGAKEAGMKFGVYLYSYAHNAQTARAEAEWCLNRMAAAGLSPSDLSLPVYYDMENEDSSGTPAGVSNGQYY